MQEVISDYQGTVLIVSHDRDFLDRTTSMTIGLDGSGKALIVAGGYRELEAAQAAGRQAVRKAAPARLAEPKAAPRAATKLNFRDKHDLDTLPARISALEAEIAAVAAKLADPALYSRAPEQFASHNVQLEKLRAALDAAENRWLEVAEKAESFG